jgi:hypothetical protein
MYKLKGAGARVSRRDGSFLSSSFEDPCSASACVEISILNQLINDAMLSGNRRYANNSLSIFIFV